MTLTTELVVSAASVALRDATPGAYVIVEGSDGPRFPNGVVAAPDEHAATTTIETGRCAASITARRWWDPALPSDQLRPELIARFLDAVEPTRLPASPENCIGWGPGLTPAGDDVIVGMLLAFRASGSPARADDLAAACAGVETSPLSRSLLDHAARGEAARPVLDLLTAIAGRGDLGLAIDALNRFGATSGTHLIEGVRRVLVAVPSAVAP